MASSEAADRRAVQICEVGPRDGLQNIDRRFTVAERIALIDMLSAAGLPRIEAVSFVHPARVPQMADPEAVLAYIARPPGVRFAGLVLNRRGGHRAMATALDEIRFVLVATETMSRRNQGASMAENVAAFRQLAGEVKAAGRTLTAVIAVAFGCPFEGEVAPEAVVALAAAAIAAGADEIVLADTIGTGVPRQVRDLAARLAPVIGGRPLGFHFHNTRNTGYANAVAAIEAGAAVLDASIGGLGGCPFAPGATGNIATEDLCYLLRRSGCPVPASDGRLFAAVAWLGDRVPGEISGQLHRVARFPPDAAS